MQPISPSRRLPNFLPLCKPMRQLYFQILSAEHKYSKHVVILLAMSFVGVVGICLCVFRVPLLEGRSLQDRPA